MSSVRHLFVFLLAAASLLPSNAAMEPPKGPSGSNWWAANASASASASGSAAPQQAQGRGQYPPVSPYPTDGGWSGRGRGRGGGQRSDSRGGGRGFGGGRGNGRGRGGGGGGGGDGGRGRGGRGGARGGRGGLSHTQAGISNGQQGQFHCDYVHPSDIDSPLAGTTCPWRAQTQLALTLHKADRHLIYPSGGVDALRKVDPMILEEERDKQRRKQRKARDDQLNNKGKGRSAAADGQDSDEEEEEEDEWDEETQMAMTQGAGLNVDLSSPEMVQQWLQERKKRWPTQEAIQRKLIEDEWRGKDRAGPKHPRRRSHDAQERPATRPRIESAQDKTAPVEAAAAVAEAPAEEDEDDDDDAPEEQAIIRQEPQPVAEPAAEPPAAPAAEPAAGADTVDPAICKFWLQGNCGYGDKCRYKHEGELPPDVQERQDRKQRNRPRPHPRAPPANPFAQPDLLRQLLAAEIDQHVSATIQCIRFIVKNEFLVNVERQPGAAQEQQRRRGLITEVGSDVPKADTLEAAPASGTPLQEGAFPTIESETRPGARSLIRPPSPALRPLTSLQWPPEPDPMIFLDPLKRDDPKPLRPAQLEEFAVDPIVREVLCPPDNLHPSGELNKSLARGLTSLLELPSEAHRISAIELILGVSELSPAHAHDLAAFDARNRARHAQKEGPGKRQVHGETELFKLGLRIGPLEVPAVRILAERVSRIMGGSVDYSVQGEAPRMEDQWRREGERRDMLRKLGIDID